MPFLNQIHDVLSQQFFGNSLLAWSVAGAVTFGMLLALLGLRAVVRRYHKKMLATEKTEIMEVPLEMMGRTTLPFFIILSVSMGLKSLSVSERTGEIFNSIITVALFWQMGVWLSAAVEGWLERKRRQSLASDRSLASSISIIVLIARILIWALVLLLTLDNLGVNVTALVAGLGIGGIAVALAVQNVLGDLFASLSIALDKPFVVGDSLAVGDFVGSVEYIGIKSTRLRSVSGEQIIISNADLLGSRIRNFGRMAERRILFTLNLASETPADLIERIPQEIRRVVEAQKGTRFDRSHFSAYGAHSLDFETVYYVLTADYKRYMDIHQAINLEIFRTFERLHIAFASPTQKLYLAGVEPAALERSLEPATKNGTRIEEQK